VGGGLGGGSAAGSAAGGSVAGDAFEDEPVLPQSIQVKLLDGRKGTLVGNKGTLYSVEILGGETTSVSRDEIEIVRPSKKDRLVILKGELAGQTGTLIGIDGADGIVKMTANLDIKILDLESCAKMADNLG